MTRTIILMLVLASFAVASALAVIASRRLYAGYREHFTATARDELQKLFVFMDARRVFLFNLAAFGIVPVAVYFATNTLLFALIGGLVFFFVPRFAWRHLFRRRIERFEHDLPDALGMVAGSMRAGASFTVATEGMVREIKGPISQEFSLVLREQRMGITLDESLENLAKRLPSEDLLLVVAATRIAREVGGSLAEICERLADTIRQKHIMEGKIKALTSQGKLQGWVVGLLPIAIMWVLYQMETDAMRPLFHSIGGWATLAVIGLLELLGIVFIRKIVSIDI